MLQCLRRVLLLLSDRLHLSVDCHCMEGGGGGRRYTHMESQDWKDSRAGAEATSFRQAVPVGWCTKSKMFPSHLFLSKEWSKTEDGCVGVFHLGLAVLVNICCR